jgi:MoxR-like ATPase
MPVTGGPRPQLDSDAKAVIDLARIGLRGDSDSVRAYVRRLLRDRSGSKDVVTKELARLVASDQPWKSVFRAQAAVPREEEANLALLRVESGDPAVPYLADSATLALDRILEEHRRVEELTSAGLSPSRTLLLTGPPGTGKTMAARFLASSLERPLLVLDLAALMSSLLGKTGQNLRAVLDFARQQPALLLLDEFDALAKRRDDDTDIGELKRIVNVLLLELERWPAGGLLIAATNHPELLDRAVERRFDAIVRFTLPDEEVRASIISALTPGALEPRLIRAVAAATTGLSGADLTRLVENSRRRTVLRATSLDKEVVAEVLAQLQSMPDDRDARYRFARLASGNAGMSRRSIGRLLGISHPTVAKMLSSNGSVADS